jgi:acyl carrier protein
MSSTAGRLEALFREVFDDDDITLSMSTTAADIDGWDSLMHVTLMVQVEKRFAVRFASAQIAALENVGQLVDLIDQRLHAVGGAG